MEITGLNCILVSGGPIGGPAIGHIVIPEDYRDYVESKLSNQSQEATEVELSASAEECDNSCLYW